MSNEPLRMGTDTNTGLTTMEWVGERPAAVLVASELIEHWVEDRNRFVTENAALRTLVEIYKLGRRPNRDQLIAAGMSPSDADLDAIRARL